MNKERTTGMNVLRISRDLKLGAKLLTAFLIVGVIPFAVMAIVALTKAQSALHEQAFAQMQSMRDVKKGQVISYLDTIKNQALTFSENRMIITAMSEFSQAFDAFRDENDIDSDEINALRGRLAGYYRNDFSTVFKEQNHGRSPDVDAIIRQLDDSTVALQYHYIKANPHPLGSKDGLDRAGDQSRYSQIHGKYHPIIRDYLKKFGYYDIFLVHPETGRIVYSVFKELDFATSLTEGPYAGTNFADAYRKANSARLSDTVVFTDFKQYFPSYEAPAGFVASPIFDGNQKVGILIFQFPIDTLNAIMKTRAGMGESGETYLVGSDKLMRSDSYLDPDHHSVAASFRDTEKGKVDTEASRSALKGETDEKIIIDYNGNPVLSAYTPLEIEGLKWALLAEIDEAEAFAAITTLQRIALLVAVIGIAGIIAIALLITRAIVKPVKGVVTSLTDLAQGEGDLTLRLPVTGKDEVGQLAEKFNQFMEKLQTMIKDISSGVETLSSSSTELSAISQQMADGSKQVSDKSNEVATASEEMSANMNSVSAAMEQSSTNASMVASAAEEMTSTINEIAQNAEKARTVSDQAVTKVGESTDQMNELGHAANAIGKVVETITDISEQVNLLALNATIEAARAGEAGKGFAVVANEIKELAKQTSDATMDIKDKISNIQQSSGGTLESINQISQVIAQVNDIVATIASSVEEQSSATKEIAQNITQASTGIQEVNENVNQSSAVANDITKSINEVNQSASEMSSSSEQVKFSASELSTLAEQLNQMVNRFKV
jgi:methyl-accepting chemotaxis protein